MLALMAEAVELVEPGTEGAVECKAPGCSNWFVKRSGRHVYCKAPTCTYRRGAPPEPALVAPEGAAEELLRRLQESDEAEVGPSLLAERRRAVSDALRAGDTRALYGALVDEATASIWWAERAARGEMPTVAARPQAPAAQAARPVGLMQATIASHQRTYQLGDRRAELIYELAERRELLASAALAVNQTQGTPQEEAAREAHRAARVQLDASERALQSVEAAWRERAVVVQELAGAAAAGAPPSQPNGGPRAAAA